MRFVLINGWSASSVLWSEFAQLFSVEDQFEVIDLDRSLTIEGWLDEIDEQVQEGDILLGWSLGGELAIQFAAEKQKNLKGLCLFQTNPCFVQREDRPEAMPKRLFEEFDSLVNEGNIDQILKQFAFMMVQGSDQLRQDLRALKSLYLKQTDQQPGSLQSGMQLLRELDVRAAFKKIRVPTLKIYGKEDTLVPVAVAQGESDIIIDGMAHLPCLSYREQVFSAMMEFLKHHD